VVVLLQQVPVVVVVLLLLLLLLLLRAGSCMCQASLGLTTPAADLSTVLPL